jgi:hypothetical protein
MNVGDRILHEIQIRCQNEATRQINEMKRNETECPTAVLPARSSHHSQSSARCLLDSFSIERESKSSVLLLMVSYQVSHQVMNGPCRVVLSQNCRDGIRFRRRRSTRLFMLLSRSFSSSSAPIATVFVSGIGSLFVGQVSGVKFTTAIMTSVLLTAHSTVVALEGA